ncbi:tripartite tricarboxylate transporter substrate binding protein [Xanthobacter sp. DSM 24535]|uniref:Bug family tripartite tricarboxylate transporter substrate binding protein n=1 Tax=Roseixanthobacter psychrophilus TaxID=3119917 RepID=UPI0037264074
MRIPMDFTPVRRARRQWESHRLFLLGLLALFATGLPAYGETDFPDRPIRLIVPFGPGGSTDVVGRALAEQVGKQLDRTVVVENKPGAAGSIGLRAIAQSTPDGLTFALGSTGTLAINPIVDTHLPYNPKTDLEPVALFAFVSNVFVISPDQKSKTLAEFIAASKAHPGTFNYGSPGIGHTSHLLGELLKLDTGADMTLIPYKSDNEVSQDLQSGRIQAAFMTLIAATPLIQSGAARPLGLVAPQRSPKFPEVPTFAEQGYKSLQNSAWFGVVAPRGTPAPLVAKFAKAIEKAVATPEMKQILVRIGLDPTYQGQDEFKQYIAAETEKWAKVVEASGIPKR